MKKIILYIFFLFFCQNAFAWQHGISLGYGFAPKNTENYRIDGMFLDAKLHKFKPLDRTLFLILDGSWGHWRAATKEYSDLDALALSGTLRAYFTKPAQQRFKPYLLLSVGPAYLSKEQFGKARQGSHIVCQTTFGAGSEVLVDSREFEVNLRFVHYCNGGLAKPNESVNIVYVLSVGYLF
jgi:hypothetical protein